MSRSTTGRRSGRRRGESDTRAAIAAAARRLFATSGYDGVNIRAIASHAGVDPALIHHFFRTKRRLFDQVTQLPFEPAEVIPALLSAGKDGLGERIVRFILTLLQDTAAREAIVGMLRTAVAHPDAGQIIRESYTRRLLEPVAHAIDADQPRLRAALCSAQLLGIVLTRHVVAVEPIASAGIDALAPIFGDTLQRYLTEPLPSRDECS